VTLVNEMITGSDVHAYKRVSLFETLAVIDLLLGVLRKFSYLTLL